MTPAERSDNKKRLVHLQAISTAIQDVKCPFFSFFFGSIEPQTELVIHYSPENSITI